MKKNLLKLVLTFSFIFSALSSNAFVVDGITYSVSNSTTKTVNVAQGNYNGVIKVPEKVTYDGVEYTVTGVSMNAFNSSGATSISLPPTVTSLGMMCFQFSAYLESITLSDNITSIPVMAFDGCSMLKSITIPAAATSMGIAALQNCTLLEEVIFPENSVMTTLNMSVFNNCAALTNLILPNSITTIESNCFQRCSSLKNIKLPENLKTINSNLFLSCSTLETISFPASVTSIGETVFGGCYGMKKVILPAGVQTIGKECFADCTSLNEIYYGAELPIMAMPNIFSETTYESATLFISEEAKSQVAETLPWSKFLNVEVFDFAGVADITSDKDFPIEIYNLNGMKMSNNTNLLSPGIYVKRQGSKTSKFRKTK